MKYGPMTFLKNQLKKIGRMEDDNPVQPAVNRKQPNLLIALMFNKT